MGIGNWKTQSPFMVAQPHLLTKKHHESPPQLQEKEGKRNDV